MTARIERALERSYQDRIEARDRRRREVEDTLKHEITAALDRGHGYVSTVTGAEHISDTIYGVIGDDAVIAALLRVLQDKRHPAIAELRKAITDSAIYERADLIAEDACN